MDDKGLYRPPALAGAERPSCWPTIVEAIRSRVAQHPLSPAIATQDSTLTYAELWARAIAVAVALREAGAGRGDNVALRADRTSGTIAAALGIMVLGAAYVPLDPTNPEARTQAILEGADPVLLVHDGGRAPAFQAGRPVANLDLSDLPDVPGGAAAAFGESAMPKPEDVAYVMFTSGSTGRPKGVMVEHRNLANYSSWFLDTSRGAEGGSPLLGSLGYDASITTLWPTLAAGGVVAVAEGMWDTGTLFGERPEPYAYMKMTPSHLRFYERVQRPDYARRTRLLVLGGEALDPELVTATAARLVGTRVMNHYGPTEATVGCCYHEFDPATPIRSAGVPIGRPIWNTRAYVVDERLEPARDGIGELVVAGAAVAAGYRGTGGTGGFLDESALGGPPGRAYRTGDIVELLAEGTLLYRGRRDDQFKVNGFRIEAGEVRRAALGVHGVREVAVDVLRDALDRVELYVVADAGSAAASAAGLADDVLAALRATLPPGAAPQRVHVVDRIELTANGKVDIAVTRARAGSA